MKFFISVQTYFLILTFVLNAVVVSMSDSESSSSSSSASRGEEEPSTQKPKKPSRRTDTWTCKEILYECYPEDLFSEGEYEEPSEEEDPDVEKIDDGISHYKNELRKLIHTSEIEYMIRDKWPQFFVDKKFQMPDSPELKKEMRSIRELLETHYSTILSDTRQFLIGAMAAMEKELEGPIGRLTEIIDKESGPREEEYLEKIKARKLKALEKKRKRLEEKEKAVKELSAGKNGKKKKKCPKREESSSSSEDDSSYSEEY